MLPKIVGQIVTKECKSCGVTFDITPGEQAWYKEKGFKLPERCKACRVDRRKQKGDHHEGKKS